MDTLGLIAIAAGGTPVQITDKSIGAVTVTFQAKPLNAGIVHVGFNGMVTSTGVGVIGVIPKPASGTTGPFAELTLPVLGMPSGGYRLNQFYIDGTTGDGVYVRYNR